MIALLDATLRVSALLLVALLLVRLFRRRTASLRHGVLLIALACAAMVPALGMLLPSWASRAVVVPVTFPLLAIPERPSAPANVLSAPHSIVASHEPRSAAWATATAAPVQTDPWRVRIRRTLDVAGVVYIAGLIVSLVTLLVGLLQLGWIAARSTPMRSEPWQRQAAAIASAYHLRRAIDLARSPHPSVLAMWGVARPQVLLPAGAEEWPENRIRAVLLHELAHVRRNDWIVQMFASVLRAIYWFNPLLWAACARLRQESEQACDDVVIEQGMGETEYAAHLLALARTLKQPALGWAPAPSMARRSTLARRIAGILDPAVPRARATRMSMVRIAASLLLITCAVAACHVAQPVRNPPDVAVVSGPTAGMDSPVAAATAPAVARTAGARPKLKRGPIVLAPDPRAVDETPALRGIAASILDLIQTAAAKADETAIPLTQFDWLARGLQATQRQAQAVIDDNGRDPASLPARCTALINTLGNTADSAAEIASRPGPRRLSAPVLEGLAANLRAKAAELSGVLLPIPLLSSNVILPQAPSAARTANDLARAALDDPMFVGQGYTWLKTELNTLQRASASVVLDDGANPGVSATKLDALLASASSTARNAYGIADRPGESAAVREKVKNLAASLRDLALQLEATRYAPVIDDVPTGGTGRTIPGTAAVPAASGLCDSSEQAVFSCQVGEKILSVCSSRPAAPASGSLTYRFGKSRKKIELEYPASPADVRGNFRFAWLAGGRWADRQLSFSIERYTYTVISYVDGLRAWQNFSGVAVSQDDKMVTFRPCSRPEADVDKLYLFAGSDLPEGEYLPYFIPPGSSK